MKPEECIFTDETYEHLLLCSGLIASGCEAKNCIRRGTPMTQENLNETFYKLHTGDIGGFMRYLPRDDIQCALEEVQRRFMIGGYEDSDLTIDQAINAVLED